MPSSLSLLKNGAPSVPLVKLLSVSIKASCVLLNPAPYRICVGTNPECFALGQTPTREKVKCSGVDEARGGVFVSLCRF